MFIFFTDNKKRYLAIYDIYIILYISRKFILDTTWIVLLEELNISYI